MARFCLSVALVACACAQLHAADVTETVKESMTSIPQALTDILWNQLQNDKTDYVNGFLALAVGYVCVYSAETIYKYLFVIIAFLGANLVASNQIAEDDINLKTFEVMQVSLLAAYIAYKSTRGLNILFGASIGYGVAKFLEDQWFSARDVTESTMPGSWIVSWYALSIFVFVRLFNSKYHLQLLAIITSVMGGAFMSSAISYFTTIYMVGCCSDQLKDTWWAQPKTGPYVDFLLLLYKHGANDVGLFSGEMWRPWPNLPQEHVNRFYGYLLWAWFIFVGVRTQLRELRASVKKEAEGNLEEPLLPQ